MVQSVVYSNYSPDPVIFLWKHTGVRPRGSVWSEENLGIFSGSAPRLVYMHLLKATPAMIWKYYVFNQNLLHIK